MECTNGEMKGESEEMIWVTWVMICTIKEMVGEGVAVNREGW